MAELGCSSGSTYVDVSWKAREAKSRTQHRCFDKTYESKPFDRPKLFRGQGPLWSKLTLGPF